MSGVRRIVPLTLGWDELPRSVSVHGPPADERLREPVPGVLLKCDGVSTPARRPRQSRD